MGGPRGPLVMQHLWSPVSLGSLTHACTEQPTCLPAAVAHPLAMPAARQPSTCAPAAECTRSAALRDWRLIVPPQRTGRRAHYTSCGCARLRAACNHDAAPVNTRALENVGCGALACTAQGPQGDALHVGGSESRAVARHIRARGSRGSLALVSPAAAPSGGVVLAAPRAPPDSRASHQPSRRAQPRSNMCASVCGGGR